MKPLLLASVVLALRAVRRTEDPQPFLALDSGGHTARWAVLFLKGDRELVSISEDKTVRIWDVISGDPDPDDPRPDRTRPRRQAVRGGPVPRWQADGRGRPGAAGHRQCRRVYIVSLADGTLLQKLTGHKEVIFSMSVSADGQRIASGSAVTTASASGTWPRSEPSTS